MESGNEQIVGKFVSHVAGEIEKANNWKFVKNLFKMPAMIRINLSQIFLLLHFFCYRNCKNFHLMPNNGSS